MEQMGTDGYILIRMGKNVISGNEWQLLGINGSWTVNDRDQWEGFGNRRTNGNKCHFMGIHGNSLGKVEQVIFVSNL